LQQLKPTFLSVKDISGGCGSMYQVSITSQEFKNKSLVQQHKMVTQILKEEIKNMH
ncbi:bola protein, partial [Gorgonomyces haynaldii]